MSILVEQYPVEDKTPSRATYLFLIFAKTTNTAAAITTTNVTTTAVVIMREEGELKLTEPVCGEIMVVVEVLVVVV